MGPRRIWFLSRARVSAMIFATCFPRRVRARFTTLRHVKCICIDSALEARGARVAKSKLSVLPAPDASTSQTVPRRKSPGGILAMRHRGSLARGRAVAIDTEAQEIPHLASLRPKRLLRCNRYRGTRCPPVGVIPREASTLQ